LISEPKTLFEILMAKANAAVNAGVHNSTGIEFQKHCAIYLLLSRFPLLNGQQYFLCIEHLDDVLFCFVNPTGAITNIEAYQAKKSSTPWTMGNDLVTIVKKLTQTGLNLIADTHPKETSYSHTLDFITNDSIKLNCGMKDPKLAKTETINESNDAVKYATIDPAIKANFVKKLKKVSVSAANQLAELDNLGFMRIDLPKKSKEQKNQLIGLISTVFGEQVSDPAAAIESLLLIFRDVENVLNNGNIVQLLDASKRVESGSIQHAINIITTKAKAYDMWRKQDDKLCTGLNISVFDRDRFKTQFQNSIDLFKDIKQAEHRKILAFAKTNKLQWQTHTDEVSCIQDMYKSFIKLHRSGLQDLDLKAAICAAYVEIKG
jgi:hypothetical protein